MPTGRTTARRRQRLSSSHQPCSASTAGPRQGRSRRRISCSRWTRSSRARSWHSSSAGEGSSSGTRRRSRSCRRGRRDGHAHCRLASSRCTA
eukprot:scaffold76419_cov27-Phaeocystis_antarctica.AAC.2